MSGESSVYTCNLPEENNHSKDWKGGLQFNNKERHKQYLAARALQKMSTSTAERDKVIVNQVEGSEIIIIIIIAIIIIAIMAIIILKN